MSDSDPASTRGMPQQPVQDTHKLIAQLTSLMPLLLRLHGQFSPPSPQSAPGGFMAPNPTLDHHAAVNLVEDITAGSLRTLSTYLEANFERNAGLQGCVTIITQAAQCYAARDFAQAFELIWQVYRVITMLRAADPQLPPVRTAEAAAAFPPSTTSMH